MDLAKCKNFQRAIKIIKEDMKDCAETYYNPGEICSVKELIDMYDYSSLELKEEIYEILKLAASTTSFPWCFTDDLDIEEEDGTIIEYRYLAKEVRKLEW